MLVPLSPVSVLVFISCLCILLSDRALCIWSLWVWGYVFYLLIECANEDLFVRVCLCLSHLKRTFVHNYFLFVFMWYILSSLYQYAYISSLWIGLCKSSIRVLIYLTVNVLIFSSVRLCISLCVTGVYIGSSLCVNAFVCTSSVRERCIYGFLSVCKCVCVHLFWAWVGLYVESTVCKRVYVQLCAWGVYISVLLCVWTCLCASLLFMSWCIYRILCV